MRRFLLFIQALCLGACGAASPSQQVQAYVGAELDAFLHAAQQLHSAAPTPQSDGWQVPRDAAALQASRQAWKDARVAYEHVEAAIAALFPEQDHAVDGRYDDFPAQQGTDGGAPPDAFNGESMTGMHAIERILWSHAVPQAVRTFERTLNRYQEPAFPQDGRQAAAYRNVLVAHLIEQVRSMQRELDHNHLDLAAAFGGVHDSMKEQREKVNLAGQGSDESRYAQHTLADMRANLHGGRSMYEFFRPQLRKQENGAAVDRAIVERFASLQAAYAAYPGDSLPPAPAGWSSQNVNPQLLHSDYGVLWQRVVEEADMRRPESLVALMANAQELLELEK